MTHLDVLLVSSHETLDELGDPQCQNRFQTPTHSLPEACFPSVLPPASQVYLWPSWFFFSFRCFQPKHLSMLHVLHTQASFQSHISFILQKDMPPLKLITIFVIFKTCLTPQPRLSWPATRAFPAPLSAVWTFASTPCSRPVFQYRISVQRLLSWLPTAYLPPPDSCFLSGLCVRLQTLK